VRRIAARGMKHIEDGLYPLSGRAGLSSTTGAAWSLLWLRTDSVNRGFCISLVTLEMIFFAISIRFFFFFIIKSGTGRAQNPYSGATTMFRRKISFRRSTLSSFAG
jgi:hypothetical protein